MLIAAGVAAMIRHLMRTRCRSPVNLRPGTATPPYTVPNTRGADAKPVAPRATGPPRARTRPRGHPRPVCPLSARRARARLALNGQTGRGCPLGRVRARGGPVARGATGLASAPRVFGTVYGGVAVPGRRLTGDLHLVRIKCRIIAATPAAINIYFRKYVLSEGPPTTARCLNPRPLLMNDWATVAFLR